MVPRVTVVIPCFNLGGYLPGAVASVRSQTFTDVEIVVVDDGSSEADTRRAIDAVAAPDVRVIRTGHGGLSAARNAGLRNARGEYVSCLDADDLFEPEWLDVAVARLDADPGLAFVSHWLETFGEEQVRWTPGRADLPALLDQNTFNGGALFRRVLVDQVGGFDESIRDGCEDWEFWIRVLAAGHRGGIVPRVLYRYRRRPGSMSQVMNESGTWFELYGTVVDKHPDVFREHLLDLLLRREWTIARLCRSADALQQELSTALEPALQERRLEVDRARLRLDRMTAHEELVSDGEALAARVQDLEAANGSLTAAHRYAEHECALAHQRIDAIHRSWSWRLTAPLRRIYAWIARP
jgi:hypothetical protein